MPFINAASVWINAGQVNPQGIISGEFGNSTTTTGDVTVTIQRAIDFINAHRNSLNKFGAEEIDDKLRLLTDDDDTDDDTEHTVVGSFVDIDISSLGIPEGTEVTVGISYDFDKLRERFEEEEARMLEEHNLAIMHYRESLSSWEVLRNSNEDINDGDVVNILRKVVYGVTKDFSLFAPAVGVPVDDDENDDDDDNDDRRRNNNNDGPRPPIVITWPPSDIVPIVSSLGRVLVGNSAFLNAAGLEIDEARVNQQVSIAGEFTNTQDEEQDYAFIIQVIDDNDVVTEIAWQQGTLESGETVEVSTLWTPEYIGDYEVKIFVWDGISTTPEPLSTVTVKNISVS